MATLRPINDPNQLALRRAARAAIVLPSALAFAEFVIRDPDAVAFAAFGCFALLVMADFGGRRRPRAVAYLTATLVGAALIAMGTLASRSPWLGAAAMLIVAFVVQFIGVFGGYIVAAQKALLLAFVLSVAVSAPPTAIPSRLIGWGIAGVVSTAAGTFLWPRLEHSAIRSKAATACRALAALIGAERVRPNSPGVPELREEAQSAVTDARLAYTTTPYRTTGPAHRDRAFVTLLSELERILAFVAQPSVWSFSAEHPHLFEGDMLAAAVVRSLEGSAQVLTDHELVPDLVALEAARSAHRLALDNWASSALLGGSSPEKVLAGLDGDRPLRVVSILGLALGADSLIATGRPLPPGLQLPIDIPIETGLRASIGRIGQTIRIHAHPQSSVLQNSLRVAVGLAAAVLLGGVLQLEHAFWVVLGTLSALRSSALATGRTTVQTLVGTVIGVSIGAPFIYLVGYHTEILWFIIPVAVFFAAYATTAIGFVAGQAAFTLVVIILFNLIAPTGWAVGLVRLEDIALGVGISLLVGLLLWPRGLRTELRRGLANFYHACAEVLNAAFGEIFGLGTAEAYEQARSVALRSGEREGETFDQYVSDHGSRHLAPEVIGSLGLAGWDAMLAGDALHALAGTGYHSPGPAEADAVLARQARALVATFAHLADQLGGNVMSPQQGEQEEQVDEAALRAAILEYLSMWKEDPAQAHQAAFAAVSAGEWIHLLAELAAGQAESVSKLVAASQVPWWR